MIKELIIINFEKQCKKDKTANNKKQQSRILLIPQLKTKRKEKFD